MQTFKKTSKTVVISLFILVLLSAVIIEPMIYQEKNYYNDASLRESLAGKIDTIFIGDSDGLSAFKPEIYDEITGSCSYNLSGTMMTVGSIKFMLEKEMKRNPVKTVMLQISHEMLCRKPGEELGDGESVIIQRLDNIGERNEFLFSQVKFDDWLNIYSRLLVTGIVDWKETLMGNKGNGPRPQDKGWHLNKGNDITIADENVVELYNSNSLSGAQYDFYEQEFTEIINIAKSYGAEVKIVILPVADCYIWEHNNWDNFYTWMENFSKERNVDFIDVNLYKERFSLFKDNESYKDYAHMSESGADNLSSCLAKIITNKVDRSEAFYESYEDMKKNSPYMSFLSSQ